MRGSHIKGTHAKRGVIHLHDAMVCSVIYKLCVCPGSGSMRSLKISSRLPFPAYVCVFVCDFMYVSVFSPWVLAVVHDLGNQVCLNRGTEVRVVIDGWWQESDGERSMGVMERGAWA